ncbi:hypothetical protein HPB50_026345 [Hyalomma asiaticum]|uniref:Uncharacterized protein n=1 Tax=Hyalomma asiaticum TaxID=266040 RepID=A0ACB7SZW1_HYAAI|nr:hypothetical protein HPB50_026345 [Hyalomma asiaticum]
MRNRVDGRWDVAAVAMLTTLLAVATHRTMGRFFVAYMEEFILSRQTASWPGFVILGCHRLAGLLVGMLHKRLSLFSIGLLGSFLAWSGITVSAFVPNIAWMSFTMGFVHGIGSGTTIQSHTVVVLHHFMKYRGVAAGIMYAANPVSALLFPAVLAGLHNAYGFRGTLLVYSAIIMHMSALSIILKEPPWASSVGKKTEMRLHGKQGERKVSAELSACHVRLMAQADEPAAAAFSMEKILHEADRRTLSSLKADTVEPQIDERVAQVTSFDDDGLGQACSEHTQERILLHQSSVKFRIANANNEYLSSQTSQESQLKTLAPSANIIRSCRGCSEQLHLIRVTEHHSQDVSRTSTAAKKTAVSISNECGTCAVVVSRSRLSTLSIERLRRVLRSTLPAEFSAASFTVAVLGSTLLDYVNTVHIFTMVDYARDKVVSHTHAVMALTYAALPELLGRLLIPLIADIGWVSRPFLTCGCAVSAGALFALTPEATQVMHLVMRGLSSVLMGALVTMKIVLVADYMGTEAVCVVSGVSGSFLVPGLLCNPFIFGECYSSFVVCMRINAFIVLSCRFALIRKHCINLLEVT